MMKKRILALFLCCAMLAASLPPVFASATASPEALLNGEKLTPVKTNYQPLDELVQDIFAKILKPGMSAYEKVRACYSYLIEDSTYAVNQITSDLYYSIGKTVLYESDLDSRTVCEAFGMLKNKIGTCNHFASSLMVMTRAIGFESYIMTCFSSGVSGTKDHYFVVIKLQGNYYAFDARMGLLRNASGNDGFKFFCIPISELTTVLCDVDECINDYGGFRTVNAKSFVTQEEIEGAAEGYQYFSFGSYPQTLVTDKELITKLDATIKESDFISYRYFTGTGTIGSQKQSDFMRYADIVYKGEKYRAVTFSTYKPTFLYYSSAEENSFQDDNGFEPNVTYWFRFDPLEWRLTDGNNLLVCNFAIDAQPFNTTEYYDKNGKTFNGILCHYFGDAQKTYLSNDWEHSFIRKWLNDDFYETAFSVEEKKLIQKTKIANNGYADRFPGNATEDNVWLLSFDDLNSSDYFFSTDSKEREVEATDYALLQGAAAWKNESNTFVVPWRLRSSGFHSDDTCFVATENLLHYHMNSLATMAGIRPVLRISEPEALCAANPEKPGYITARATGTNEITVRCAVVNGADGYRFYRYSADGKICEETYTSEKPIITVTGLTAGETYAFRASATVQNDGEETETPLSDIVSLVCRCLVTAPMFPSAESLSTGTITLSWNPISGADHYIIYQYIDKTHKTPVAQSESCTAMVTGLSSGYVYYFTVTAVSADGYESKHSTTTEALCTSYPAKPQDVAGQPTATGEITLTWTPSEDAQYYRIYRYTSEDTVELAGTTAGSSFTVTGLHGGSTYYFFVVAVTDNGKNVSASSSLIIVQSKTLPKPIPTDTPKATAIIGDLDGDWIVTSADARLALRLSVGLEKIDVGSLQYLAGDADGDGKVASADARLILRTSVGLETLVGIVIIP